jgi:hypothetical protein
MAVATPEGFAPALGEVCNQLLDRDTNAVGRSAIGCTTIRNGLEKGFAARLPAGVGS